MHVQGYLWQQLRSSRLRAFQGIQSPWLKPSRSLVCVWQQQLVHGCSLIWATSIAVDLGSVFWPAESR